MLQSALIWGAAVLAVLFALNLIFRLPQRAPARRSAPPPLPPSSISRHFAPLATGGAGDSAIHPLPQGKSAFAARMALIDLAEHAIDVQYYIWRADLTGLLLLDRLRTAGERGVKVRLLLDDNGVAGLDPVLAELDAHPNISVRLYNPFVIRRPRIANYAFDFFRLNRRMHNKAMIFDGAVTITGGRNIGDEYFDTGSNPLFVDLDVIAAGAAADAVGAAFARYWDSRSAHPFAAIAPAARDGSQGALDTALEAQRTGDQLRRYAGALAEDPVTRNLVARRLVLEPARAALVCDAPDKTLGTIIKGDLLVDQLAGLLGTVERRFDLVSPYFVPGRRGLAQFRQLAQRGIKVRVLTNALEANDVALVHAGYRKYRRRLLESGVELFELKAHATPASRNPDAGRIGASSASLHAKTFSADGKTIFIGSFNFDPRSVWLNTEMGLVIESTGLAGAMHAAMDEGLAGQAYRVCLDDRGRMRWEDPQTGALYFHDPGSGTLKRLAIRALGWLPIEWLL